ncbi:ATP-binding cassette domain-containing protein, partial [Pontibacterium sp.]|uniref:ATP-binding cassette domain-containing protein n=1 Tax=Pontibacterium sp. TaxID=2036026 RepID=UPI00351146C9
MNVKSMNVKSMNNTVMSDASMMKTSAWQDLAPLLSVRDVNKYYAPGKGCGPINFDLYPGEVLGIVGESGSGKSTLLSCLSARQTPDSGQIIYNSEQVGEM